MKLDLEDFEEIIKISPLNLVGEGRKIINVGYTFDKIIKYDIENKKCKPTVDQIDDKEYLFSDPAMQGVQDAVMGEGKWSNISPNDFLYKLIDKKFESEPYKSTKEELIIVSRAARGDHDKLREALDKFPKPNSKTPSKVTALHAAAKNDCDQCAKILLERGANPKYKTYRMGTGGKKSLLKYSYKESSIKVVRILLDYGVDPNIEIEDDLNPIHFSARDGDLRTIKKLLEKGAEVRKANGEVSAIGAAVIGYESGIYSNPDKMCRIVDLLSKEGGSLSMYEIESKGEIVRSVNRNCDQISEDNILSGSVGRGCL